MTRILSRFLLVLSIASATAWADDLDAAKKAFEEGKALYDSGKPLEAIAKFKESYQLSNSPFLLYNIGHTYDQADVKAKALFYYQKFLDAAPANAALRADVQKRVDELVKENVKPEDDAAAATTPATPPVPAAPKIDLQHHTIDSVPAGKPVDVTATLPASSPLTVVLFYRGTGEDTFTSKVMARQGDQLTAQIPIDKLSGSTFQYYLEVRDPAGKVVTRMGKATVPNLVTIDVPTPIAAPLTPPREDPLLALTAEKPEGPSWTSKVFTPKWISTAAAAGLFGTAIYAYASANSQHDSLVADSTACGAPPCRKFDAQYDQQVEALGNRWNTTYKVTLGLGIVALGAAGYFWYRDLTVAPVVKPGYGGAAAMVRF